MKYGFFSKSEVVSDTVVEMEAASSCKLFHDTDSLTVGIVSGNSLKESEVSISSTLSNLFLSLGPNEISFKGTDYPGGGGRRRWWW